MWWDHKDNNGLIKTGNGSKYYFDRSVVGGIKADRLKAGAFVTFEHNKTVTSCLCASNVKITPSRSLKAVEKKFQSQAQLDLLEVGSAA